MDLLGQLIKLAFLAPVKTKIFVQEHYKMYSFSSLLGVKTLHYNYYIWEAAQGCAGGAPVPGPSWQSL